MAKELPKDRPHISVPWKATPKDYTSVEGGGGEFVVPARDRKKHGEFLRKRLEKIRQELQDLEAPPDGMATEMGITLEFESSPGYPLKIKSLDRRPSGIEVLSTRLEKSPTPEDKKAVKVYATVFVPFGKLEVFFHLVEDYLTKVSKRNNKPQHKTLVESIADLRLGSLASFWTDEGKLPQLAEPGWWEAWLRTGSQTDKAGEVPRIFREEAARLSLLCSKHMAVFPERSAILIRATTRELRDSVVLQNCLAELRRAKVAADLFTSLSVKEQRELVEKAVSRILPPGKDSPAVLLLDTGLNRAHPMIEPFVPAGDIHSYNPAWDAADDTGHGTEMAGLALYGDLAQILRSEEKFGLSHGVESVKILPPRGENPPDLYGEITKASIARAEVKAPKRNRAICMTVTSDGRDRGQPSSWSAALDQAASGAGEEGAPKRLIIVSAGNADVTRRHLYPSSNETDGIQDPGQSWNALTVGAYTEKAMLAPDFADDWSPLAEPGALSPCSTTSLVWTPTHWPYKPDIVMEGGNSAKSKTDPTITDGHDSLSLLTTHVGPGNKLLVATGDTSAAAALAARYAAIVHARYPRLWPETVRGLLVHSARWTPAMTDGVDVSGRDKVMLERILRMYGYGVPNLVCALTSAADSLTLIAQEELQPFYKNAKNAVKTKHMNLHRLPWPLEVLRDLGHQEVRMRVTLSYFVEPNPSRRTLPARYSDATRFRYASCNLRYDVKRALEDVPSFEQRVNRIARQQASEYTSSKNDGDEWLIGSDGRTRGSIHCDEWRGTAADLAEKGFIIVKPVRGWWSERPHLGRWEDKIRYSLIVTIETARQDVDIYTPVEAQVAITV